MRSTRRDFLEDAAAVAVVGIGGSAGCSKPIAPVNRLSAAPGVELGIDDAALPDYRIEKLTFESRPQLYVTANLYVPVAAGRHPAILGPLGHSVNGKAWLSYQKLFSNLARKGYVVLAYDPFGQGERIEYPGT